MAMGDWLLERLMDFVVGLLVLCLLAALGGLIVAGVVAVLGMPHGWRILAAVLVCAPFVALLGNRLRDQ